MKNEMTYNQYQHRRTGNPIAMIFTIAALFMMFAMDFVFGDDGSGSDDKACPMEIRYHTSFGTCYESTTIATATVYADGKCHTVESNVSPSDENYSILPGNYRLECDSDGKTLTFLDSACEEGTCSQGGTCNSDVSQAGSLFGRVPGQLVQDPSVGDNYVCETLFDDDYEIFFAIFGDCSLPGCSVGGSINPTPVEPTNPPVQVPQATPKPIAAPTDAPQSTTPVPVPAPSTPDPPTQAPIVNEPTTRTPISIPTTPVNVTAAPVRVPTASPILAAVPTLLPIRVPSETPVMTPPTAFNSTTPTVSPLMDPSSSPTASPNQNIRSPTPAARPTRAPTNTLTQTSSSDGNNNVLILGAIGGTITVIVVMLLWCFVRRQCRASKSVDSKNGALATTTTSSEKTNQLRLSHDLQNNDRLLATTATNEIWFDPSRDDVSTLDGGTLPDMTRGAGGDEPTASVNMDFDYDKNQYRSTADERSRLTSGTNPTAFTTLSKLGIRGATSSSSLLDANADDLSFDQQFADMDDEEIMTAVGSRNWSPTTGTNVGAAAAAWNDIAHRVRPFEVRVPPGMLGLVIDSPNGSVPVIRAIKPSSVLYPQVQVGDRLISVNHENVTNLSAIQVSNLITQKQDENRVFVFCRLVSEIQQNS